MVHTLVGVHGLRARLLRVFYHHFRLASFQGTEVAVLEYRSRPPLQVAWLGSMPYSQCHECVSQDWAGLVIG